MGDDLVVTSLRDTVRAPLAALATGATCRAAPAARMLIAATVIGSGLGQMGVASASAAPSPVTTEVAPAPSPTPAVTDPTTPATTTPSGAGTDTGAGTTTDPGSGDSAPSTTSDPGAPDDGIVPRAPTRKVSYAARLIVPTAVRKKPSTRAKKITTLKPYGSWNGGPVVLSIAQVKVINGKRWLRVRLPIRPNNATGWVSESSVAVSKLRYRIEVSRRLHTLTLLRDGKRIASTKVVTGASSTPTPRGNFAVLEVVRQPKGSILGPWALHLTAHSNVLDNFGGGPGRVALHGRSGSLLNDPLGSSRSHGCIRMPNRFISTLAKVAAEGTPVRVR